MITSDAPAWAIELNAKLDKVMHLVAVSRHAVTQPMITARQADLTFRLREGTARAAFVAGKIRGQHRPGRGPTGQVLYLDRADADRLWGGR